MQVEPERMRDEDAKSQLRGKGFEVGQTVMHADGYQRVSVSIDGDGAWVEIGRELWDLAEGVITIEDIQRRGAK